MQFDVVVYNAISRKDEAIVVRVPVNSEKIIVMDASSNNVVCQVICISCDHHVISQYLVDCTNFTCYSNCER